MEQHAAATEQAAAPAITNPGRAARPWAADAEVEPQVS
jgi:hypothetical protein